MSTAAMQRPYHYIINDKVYDLREWIPQHPGGTFFFLAARGRDISAAVYTYHENPDYLFKILKKYEIDKTREETMVPSMNLPPFLIPKGFDARKDLVTFDFDNNNKILNEIKEGIKKEKMLPKIK